MKKQQIAVKYVSTILNEKNLFSVSSFNCFHAKK